MYATFLSDPVKKLSTESGLRFYICFFGTVPRHRTVRSTSFLSVSRIGYGPLRFPVSIRFEIPYIYIYRLQYIPNIVKKFSDIRLLNRDAEKKKAGDIQSIRRREGSADHQKIKIFFRHFLRNSEIPLIKISVRQM